MEFARGGTSAQNAALVRARLLTTRFVFHPIRFSVRTSMRVELPRRCRAPRHPTLQISDTLQNQRSLDSNSITSDRYADRAHPSVVGLQRATAAPQFHSKAQLQSRKSSGGSFLRCCTRVRPIHATRRIGVSQEDRKTHDSLDTRHTRSTNAGHKSSPERAAALTKAGGSSQSTGAASCVRLVSHQNCCSTHESEHFLRFNFESTFGLSVTQSLKNWASDSTLTLILS